MTDRIRSSLSSTHQLWDFFDRPAKITLDIRVLCDYYGQYVIEHTIKVTYAGI